MRTRNAILEAMELVRDAHPGLTLVQIIAFLHVAEEDEGEGTPLPDLQQRADLSPVQAWRTARALDDEGGEGLITLARWKTRNILAATLSPTGRDLRDRLDGILRRAAPIEPRRAVARG